jgi:hypothetical protein
LILTPQQAKKKISGGKHDGSVGKQDKKKKEYRDSKELKKIPFYFVPLWRNPY